VQPTMEVCHQPKAKQDGLHRCRLAKLPEVRFFQQWSQSSQPQNSCIGVSQSPLPDLSPLIPLC
jgi:hypothetical protein